MTRLEFSLGALFGFLGWRKKPKPPPPPPFPPPSSNAEIIAEANWILQAGFPEGAIANHIDKQNVWPYLSGFAAIGLAQATQKTGDARYVQAAWDFLTWYQSKQDANGYVTDYRLSSGTLVSTGTMDSTDSYAGMFLLAAREAWLTTHDLPRLTSLSAGIAAAVKAIESTQQSDGLTWAKPSWRVKYLMDQSETYAGLRAAAELAQVLGNSALSSRATSDANKLQTGVNGLWNASTGAYDWAVHESGARDDCDWDMLYPDSLQQAWAVAFGLVAQPRAATLMARFEAEQPTWDVPGDWWPVAGWAYRRLGNTARADSAEARIRSAAVAQGRRWPYTTGNAAQLISLDVGYRPVA